MKKVLLGIAFAFALLGPVSIQPGSFEPVAAVAQAQDAGPAAVSSDATTGGPAGAISSEAAAPTAAGESKPETPGLVEVGKEAFEKVGAPTDFSVKGLLAYAVYFLLAAASIFIGYKYQDNQAIMAGKQELDNIVDQVYIEHIEGKKGELTGKELREAGLSLAKQGGGAAAKLVLRFGPQWVMAYLHNRSNKKKQAAAAAAKPTEASQG